MDSKEKLNKQISEAAWNVFYTYIAHWNIVERLKNQQSVIKVLEIVLLALTTAGIIATLSRGISWLSWLSGLCSAGALFLNLYSLHFNLPDKIKAHTDAANELWDVREDYKSLLVDFNDLAIDDIRKMRNDLTNRTSHINKKYPGTDEKSFEKAKENKARYIFEKGEAE